MEEAGITDCSCCGWWQSDNDGIDGTLCWQCADAEADEEEFDEDE